MKHLKTTKLFLLLSLTALPAYAGEWVDEAAVAPIIKKERERSGERIYGLDNMIAPSARRMALEVSQGADQKANEDYFPSSATTKKMNEATSRELDARRAEAEVEQAVRREVARDEYVQERAAREEAAREAARVARQGEPLEVFPNGGAGGDDLPDSYYEQRGMRKPAPIQTFNQMGRRAPVAEPSIGQRIPVAEVEQEAPAAPKKYGYWDRPMPERKAIEVPAQPARPSRLTETVPAVTPMYVSNSYWDELNAARERARQAIAESQQADEAARPAPVNLPANSYGQPLNRNWKNELAQVESSLGPRQAGLGPTSFIPFGQSAGQDALAEEVKEVEKSAGFGGTQRLLSNIQSEHGTNELRERDPEDVPLLRPRFRATKQMSKKQRKALARELARNGYARGSRPNEMVREGESYEAAKIATRQPNFYRHLDNEMPSRPRGKNVRTHSIGNPED